MERRIISGPAARATAGGACVLPAHEIGGVPGTTKSSLFLSDAVSANFLPYDDRYPRAGQRLGCQAECPSAGPVSGRGSRPARQARQSAGQYVRRVNLRRQQGGIRRAYTREVGMLHQLVACFLAAPRLPARRCGATFQREGLRFRGNMAQAKNRGPRSQKFQQSDSSRGRRHRGGCTAILVVVVGIVVVVVVVLVFATHLFNCK